MKKWNVKGQIGSEHITVESIIETLLLQRNITSVPEIQSFFHPKDATELTGVDVGLDEHAINKFIDRVRTAIKRKESIVVYADYDADGVTAGAIMWEALYTLGANVMPYIPHRKEEGYGFSEKGLLSVKKEYNPTLVISVDHGITAHELIPFAKNLGMEIIVTDHHMKPEIVPDCLTLHTTVLSGAGIAFVLASYLLRVMGKPKKTIEELLPFASIGTIADMVPLIGANRSIALYGLKELNVTKRVGLTALMENAGLTQGAITAYNVSHMLAPRLNAMGRLTHALDALRLLCTKSAPRARELADVLGSTNTKRQLLTTDMLQHAKNEVTKAYGETLSEPIIIVGHESYDQGIIGLVAGRLLEEHYRPVIVFSKGEEISKASARSIAGFNIIEALRELQDLLLDVGGHPLAAGFTIETKNIPAFTKRIDALAQSRIQADILERSLDIDVELPLDAISQELWVSLKAFEPYGLGNPMPLFASRNVRIQDIRVIGQDRRHVKFLCMSHNSSGWDKHFDAIAFNQAKDFSSHKDHDEIDIAYSLSMNVWNGKETLQLMVNSTA